MAAYNAEEIKRLANLLAANVRFKLEYSAVANKTRKVLLVEGGTDVKFISNIKTSVVDCLNADHVFNSNASFRTSPTIRVNSKNAIAQLIFGISKFPSPFIAYPGDLDKWDLYGLVDLDCDELGAGVSLPRLFITDTHDLETLIMSTDESVFDNIDVCAISKEDVLKSCFVAYQLAKTRELLDGYFDEKTFDLRTISCGSREVDFSSFVNDCKINIADIANYIVKNSENVLSTPKINQLIGRIIKEKGIKKRFTPEGLWKQDLSTFDIDSLNDFWTSVNGHDVLQLIRHYNVDAGHAFHNGDSTKLNRSFELAIIEKYNYSKITATELYKKMSAEGLVNA